MRLRENVHLEEGQGLTTPQPDTNPPPASYVQEEAPAAGPMPVIARVIVSVAPHLIPAVQKLLQAWMESHPHTCQSCGKPWPNHACYGPQEGQ